MYQKFARALRNLHRGQRGMTGLETAIILIAFVTVASVLAYSVLSAGIFSAEKGKATVYGGLESAQATIDIEGVMIGVGDITNSNLDYVEFLIGMAIPGETVDMEAIVIRYYDKAVETYIDRTTWGTWNATSEKWTSQIHTDSTERGTANMLEGDELHVIKVDIPYLTANVTAYQQFTFQIIPPTGATITLQRTLPGSVITRMLLY